jgi:hypothetical protein
VSKYTVFSHKGGVRTLADNPRAHTCACYFMVICASVFVENWGEGVRRNALRVLRPKSPHSEDSAHESQSGPLRSSWLSGERRNGGKPNSCTSFILQAHFDEGAVVIYYGVLCEPPFREVGRVKDLFRFLALCA